MSITEQFNASSYLVAPEDSGDDFVKELEQSAGLVLGGIDWAIHKFFHVSVLAEIVKPITGDWLALERAESAWKNAGAATTAVAANFAALGPQTSADWTGAAGDAFRARMTSISQSMQTYAGGCQTISEVVNGLVEVSQAAAGVIATVISFIGDLITQLLAELAVPLIGWAAAGATVAARAPEFFAKMEKAYNAIKKVITAVEKVINALYKIVEALNKLQSALKVLLAAAKVDNATDVDRASANSFGTA